MIIKTVVHAPGRKNAAIALFVRNALAAE